MLSIGFLWGQELASQLYDVIELVEVIWPDSFSDIATDRIGLSDFAVARSSGVSTAKPAYPCTHASVFLVVVFSWIVEDKNVAVGQGQSLSGQTLLLLLHSRSSAR